jgi:uncharacterized protein YcbK (DUF882 family)
MNTTTVTRRRVLGTAVALAAAPSLPLAAPAINRGAGNVRMIHMLNPRTGDELKSVYWIDGAYVDEVMSAIDYLMRDWRTEEIKRISPALIDIASATHRALNTSEPFTLYSGYRSPETNRLLRANSRGVARQSYHIKGMAADLHLESRSVRQISQAATRLASGGVGRYSRSNFVHLDSGPERQWGR